MDYLTFIQVSISSVTRLLSPPVWYIYLESLTKLIDHVLKDCFKVKLYSLANFTGKFHHFIFNLLFQIINSLGNIILLSVP